MSLSEEHQEMLDQLREFIKGEVRKHENGPFHNLDSSYAWLPGYHRSPRELVSEHQRMVEDMTELADTILGRRKSELQGGGREPNGLIHQFNSIEESLAALRERTEVKLKLPPTVWAAIITALGMMAAALVGIFA